MSAQTWFDNLSPQSKRAAIVVGVLALVIVMVVALAPAERPKPKMAPEAVPNVLTPADPKELGLTAIAGELRQLKATVEAQGREQADAGKQEDPELATMREELQLLQAELQSLRESRAGAPVISVPAQAATPQAPLPPPPSFQTIEDDLEPTVGPTAQRETEDAATYLPAGTLVTGRLLYGLDASTASAAIRNPQPVVVRIKHEAILPNRARFDVRECFLTAAGYGELSSERVMLRSENLSCVHEDGRVLDIKVEAVAVGEDGKVGLRGRLVSKQGRAVGLATLAGLAEGASQALGQTTTFVTPGSGDVLSQAGSRGVSSSLDRVAEFYLEKADQLSPILEVSSAREVTFALVSGAHLTMVERPARG